MFGKLFDIYFNNYKKILIIPFVLLAINLFIIIYTFAITGTPFYLDSSLTGGASLTFNYNEQIDAEDFKQYMIDSLGTEDITIVVLRSALSNTIIGYEVQTEETYTEEMIRSGVETYIGTTLAAEDISFGRQSSLIGESFMTDSLKLLFLGFILISCVSFFYFRNIVPSLSITFSTLSDFVGIIAMLDLFQIKLSVATIGALLMTLGYSTDSDILLATNILKRTEGSLKLRMKSAIKTELTMDIAAIVTFSIMYFLSSVAIIKHIALVLLLGIVFDVINTWGQNASLQRIYSENKK